MNRTKIEWTGWTWSPITGCTPVSKGCDNCYARQMANGRLKGRHGYQADDPFRVTCHENRLEEPLRLRKPQLIFVCSMSDLFHSDIPLAFVNAVFDVMDACPQHTFQILTKRPGNMRQYFAKLHPDHTQNIWCGTSIETPGAAFNRMPNLLETVCYHKFISVEPMLAEFPIHENCLNGLDWVICGGETGPGARPMNPDWARALRDECFEAGIPFFFKQMSGGKKVPIPDDLMVQQVPEALERFFKPVPVRKEGE